MKTDEKFLDSLEEMIHKWREGECIERLIWRAELWNRYTEFRERLEGSRDSQIIEFIQSMNDDVRYLGRALSRDDGLRESFPSRTNLIHSGKCGICRHKTQLMQISQPLDEYDNFVRKPSGNLHPGFLHICFGCACKMYFCPRCHHRTRSLISRGLYPICVCCLEKGEECRNCGEFRFEEDLTRWGICDGCERDSRRKSHNYRGNIIYLGSSLTPFKLGAELEIDEGPVPPFIDFLHEIDNREEIFWIVRDGSLKERGGRGLELVSQPCTLNFHKKSFPWRKILKEARKLGFNSDASNAGLHVHISKSGFENTQAQFIYGYFIYTNQRQMEVISRRRENSQYAYYKSLEEFSQDGTRNENRYEAVNYQNANSIELRTFDTTLEPWKLFSALEFCEALAHWSNKNKEKQEINESWEKFSAFLDSRDYPNLKKLMKGL